MVIDAPRDVHLAIIRKRFPGISLADMVLHAGGEHFVYVVEGMVSYRFPQKPRPIPLVRAHAIAWLAATGAIPFALPACEIEHDDEFGIWFERVRYLPGVPLTPEVAATFGPGEMRTIARHMGAFLTTLHALPLEPARALGMDEMDPTDFWDYMENNPNAYPRVRQTLWPVLPPEERAWIARLFEGFIARARRTPLPLAIRHNDMHPYHIIVDPAFHELAGVIDFTWRIADPANDFKAFDHYGPEFVAEVYAHYGGTVDAGFEARRLFYTGHDVVFRLVRSYAGGDTEAIAEHHARLSAYIRAHPVR
ncbi:MAG: hypothetical protein AVDCRST_MAG87-764 [uncultured Thermomicrobiales bacterium]|uniref:Aminoglycoside phosphotransferase domain-containing protein n=1 Tax=uncultured Thermomicrobiales bacterium TaxID=1645740 RepID=A0A6J4UK95_9BACT|nr:MAG: hypothetical protein AVDCRST_MAG87-764 [uncultured Thermomicrobiales bacterium]